MKTDVLIVGAGAIGLSIGYELVCLGRKVMIVDRDPLAPVLEGDRVQRRSATSWAAAGILPPANPAVATDPIDRLRGLSHQMFPDWVERLKEDSDVDSGLIQSGGWYLGDTPGEKSVLFGLKMFYHDLQIDFSEVPLTELSHREPLLSDWVNRSGGASAWWAPDEWQIRTPHYLQALAKACRNRGANVVGKTAVVALQEQSGGMSATTDGNEVIHADQVVLCGGVRTGIIDRALRLQHSIVPVRGQILMLKSQPGTLKGIVNVGHRYLVPRNDGLVLVGSCEEEVGLQHGTTPSGLADLRQFVRHLCPQLATSRELMGWSGLRPMTFDGFPMIGNLPGSNSVFVASGHFRSGVHLSPGTAVCLASTMCGTPPPIDLSAFRVGKQQSQTDDRHHWSTP